MLSLMRNNLKRIVLASYSVTFGVIADSIDHNLK
jgi:hypothetical protein